MTWAKYRGRLWMNGIATASPAYTFGSWVAIQQKSSRRGLPVAGLEGPVEDEPVRVPVLEHGVLLGGVEAVVVEVEEVGRLEDGLVDVALLEEVADHGGLVVLLVLGLRPDPLRRAQVLVVGVEAVDE